MDSGATDHMMPFGSDFKNYTAIANSRNGVILGDGTTRLSILGKGTIERWVETTPVTNTVAYLKNITHLSGNL